MLIVYRLNPIKISWKLFLILTWLHVRCNIFVWLKKKICTSFLLFKNILCIQCHNKLLFTSIDHECWKHNSALYFLVLFDHILCSLTNNWSVVKSKRIFYKGIVLHRHLELWKYLIYALVWFCFERKTFETYINAYFKVSDKIFFFKRLSLNMIICMSTYLPNFEEYSDVVIPADNIYTILWCKLFSNTRFYLLICFVGWKFCFFRRK